jgi:hypothetical protein
MCWYNQMANQEQCINEHETVPLSRNMAETDQIQFISTVHVIFPSWAHSIYSRNLLPYDPAAQHSKTLFVAFSCYRMFVLNFKSSESSFYILQLFLYTQSQYNYICIRKPTCPVIISVLSMGTWLMEVKLQLWLCLVMNVLWLSVVYLYWMWLKRAHNGVCNMKYWYVCV